MLLKDWCKENNNNRLEKEWDKDANDTLGLSFETIAFRSNKPVHWKCLEGGHSWVRSVDNRTRGQNCPICSGRVVIAGVNDLATTHPALIDDWDCEKNVEFAPSDVSRITNKYVFWKCHVCGHEWSTLIRARAIDGDGCVVCGVEKRVKKKHITDLKKSGCITDPVLLADWNYEGNFPLTPEDFPPSSNKTAKWICHVCGYKWETKISNRKNGRGCPCCSNKVVVKGINDLATTHKDIAKEWHPTKNGDITPEMVTHGNGNKYWWLCPKGHEYQAAVLHRTSGTRCPICCSGRQTSFAEQAVYYYVKKVFPDAISRYKPDFLNRMELDIFIPSYRTAIEYDGVAWHGKDKLAREQKKYGLCHEHNIKLIRIREEFAELGSDIADYCFGNVKDLFEPKNLNVVIIQLLSHLTFKGSYMFDVDVNRDRVEILSYAQEIDDENFENMFPDIAKEWHPIKNGNLKPNMFKPHSDHLVWWVCPKCGYEYQSTFARRSYGNGCIKCGFIKTQKAHYKKVEMLDPKTGNVIKVFDSISKASKELHINGSNISTICKGKTKRDKAGGYGWRYAKLEDEENLQISSE